MTVTELRKRLKVLELEGHGDEDIRIGPAYYWNDDQTIANIGKGIYEVTPIGGQVRIVPSD